VLVSRAPSETQQRASLSKETFDAQPNPALITNPEIL
jgi:hypothetical protein